MSNEAKRRAKKDFFFLCESCGEFVPRNHPFQDGRCRPCHHQKLRAETILFRNRFAAGFGLAIGMNMGMLLAYKQHPQDLPKAFLGFTLAIIWPLSIFGVFAVAKALEKIFGGPEAPPKSKRSER
jgi:hypothetical protein